MSSDEDIPCEAVAEGTAAILSEEELEGWGARIGERAKPPMVIALRGDLGAVKTTLARAIARGTGVEGSIPSPTFNLLFRYRGARRVEVVHLDLYRLEDPDEVWALGWAELPGVDDLMLIEWPERAEDLLPFPRWEIRFEEVEDGARRAVRVVRIGSPPALPPPKEAND
jgi:tRNA threonylcarbamoyladenosine biosynthesis protein TsaE